MSVNLLQLQSAKHQQTQGRTRFVKAHKISPVYMNQATCCGNKLHFKYRYQHRKYFHIERYLSRLKEKQLNNANTLNYVLFIACLRLQTRDC